MHNKHCLLIFIIFGVVSVGSCYLCHNICKKTRFLSFLVVRTVVGCCVAGCSIFVFYVIISTKVCGYVVWMSFFFLGGRFG